ncbi:hypothetical protein CATYP_09490 [Corynebacterium atypicum]|uniref:Cobalamin biosynthesis protein CbiX n=1 Tax=Corynebacterium atypicum TaxID=191610 RepID=A0ABM5QPM1_9CORY|nr:CbiX/SirB N-terminal domain-containing protein [Corynebacterium atypicum]AIG64747.1 hypothetical protein CATYP_09490 [Corynebacterium atypicum]
MTPLLITLAHGSRDRRAGADVARLTAAAAGLAGTKGLSAHLELASPSLVELASRLPRLLPAVVVPLLFTSAFHARVDVPEAVSQAREVGLDARLAPGIGLGKDLAQVLAMQARSAPAGAALALYAVGSSDAQAMAQLGQLAARVGRLVGRHVSLLTATNGPASVSAQLAGCADAARARGTDALFAIPLFVASGVLLERFDAAVAGASAATGVSISRAGVLGENLAAIVAKRYRALALERVAAA